MRRILVIMPNWVGDCLMAAPLLRALKENIQDVYVCVLVHPRVREVFENNPFIDEVIEAGSKFRDTFSLFKHKFDTAILLKASFTKSLQCRLGGIKDIIGPACEKFTFINNPVDTDSRSLHKADYYLSLLEALDFKISRREPEFFLSDTEEQRAEEIFKGALLGKFTIVLHPRANWPLKEWPAEYYAELADRLIDELKASVIITGRAADYALAVKIKNLMRNEPFILAGKTSLRELAAVLKKADLFISADTGIMHLASALGVPLVAIFGSTHPEFSGPRGKGLCRIIFRNETCPVPCYKLDCKNNICMKNITPAEVFLEAIKILA